MTHTGARPLRLPLLQFSLTHLLLSVSPFLHSNLTIGITHLCDSQISTVGFRNLRHTLANKYAGRVLNYTIMTTVVIDSQMHEGQYAQQNSILVMIHTTIYILLHTGRLLVSVCPTVLLRLWRYWPVEGTWCRWSSVWCRRTSRRGRSTTGCPGWAPGWPPPRPRAPAEPRWSCTWWTPSGQVLSAVKRKNKMMIWTECQGLCPVTIRGKVLDLVSQ